MKISFDELYTDFFMGWEFDTLSFGYSNYKITGMKETKHITLIVLNLAVYLHF